MWHSLRTRLLLSHLVVILTVLAVVGLGLFLYLLSNPAPDRQALLRLETVAQTLTLRLQESSQRLSGRALQTALQRAAENYDVRILVLNNDGRVVIDTSPSDTASLVISTRLLTRVNGLVRDTNKKAWLFVSRSLPQGGYLWIATPRPARLQVVRSIFGDELLGLFGRAAFVALLISLLLAYVIARWIVAPLQRMTASAQALAHGETRPVPLEGPQEVRSLGQAFNAMAEQVQASRRSQQDFVANVSHDLKTPLTSIQGYAQALLDGTADVPELRRQAAQVIYDEAARMYRMVLDLLELARFDAGTVRLEIAPLSLKPLLLSVTEKLNPLAVEKQINLTVQADDDLPAIPADADRLTRVFANLVENAIRYTPSGGAVTLRVSRQPEMLLATVEDTGPGIPSDVLPRIFERFYQGESSRAGRKTRGSGLGLAIADEIVRAHGGSIRVFNRPQGGACFEVRLPLHRISQMTTARHPYTHKTSS